MLYGADGKLISKSTLPEDIRQAQSWCFEKDFVFPSHLVDEKGRPFPSTMKIGQTIQVRRPKRFDASA